jgi:hypothetical protein
LELYQHATHSRINPSISSSTHPLALPASIQNTSRCIKKPRPEKDTQANKKPKEAKGKKLQGWKKAGKEKSIKKWRSISTRNKLMKKKKP